jgi:superfamily I DNA/RNA helicase
MQGLLGLNEPQREAVRQTEGPVLILAGAGTGKTRVITTRIAYMIANGIRPENILAVTFTNKAAAEMRERAGGMIEKAHAKKVTISTFHSLCVKLLRQDIDKLGYKKTFGIYSGADQLGLVRKLVAKRGGKNCDVDPKVALGMIGNAKSRGLPLESIPHATAAEIAVAYQNELKLMNVVDFDDLLILAVRLLQDHRDVAEAWQARFPYIMVDEFQDTNGLQMSLLRSLAGERQHVCVVGDDDQSIYGWRGAEISNILEFERFFADPKVVKLEENYRCPMPVLHLANSIIRHNRGRREKTLWSSKESSELVRLMGMPSAEEEAQVIVGEILSKRATEERPWEDFAILFRMNAQSRPLEQALRENQIPYRVVGGMSFFDRREIKDILSYLQVFVNPEDDVNLLRVINNPPRGIGEGTIESATDHSSGKGTSVWASLRDEEFLATRSAKAREALAAFVDLVERYGEVARTPSADYATMTGNFLQEIGFFDCLKRTCKTPAEADMREQNAREFVDSLFDHRARTSKKAKGLQHFLDEIALAADRESEDDISKKKGVCLITLHAAKGLEFPVVYLVGLEEGILPHSRSIQEGTRDEERRLLYVGITRAMVSLTMTYCHSRKRYGEKQPCQPSTFIRELDRNWLQEISYDEHVNEPASEATAASFFEQMRAMLAAKG